jgi:hypothetical protein
VAGLISTVVKSITQNDAGEPGGLFFLVVIGLGIAYFVSSMRQPADSGSATTSQTQGRGKQEAARGSGTTAPQQVTATPAAAAIPPETQGEYKASAVKGCSPSGSLTVTASRLLVDGRAVAANNGSGTVQAIETDGPITTLTLQGGTKLALKRRSEGGVSIVDHPTWSGTWTKQ